MRITCLSAIGIGALLLARKRAASNLMSQTPGGSESAVTPVSVIAECPQCHVDISRVLASGGRTCPACNTQFLFSNSNSQSSARKLFAGLLSEGSSVKRIAGAVCLVAFVLFGLTWVWFAAVGNTQMSHRMLVMLLSAALVFAAVLASHTFSDRSG